MEGIEALFINYGIGYKLRRGWLQFNCPWCSDSNYHGGIRLDSPSCTCFKCGKLNLTTTISALMGKSYSEVKKLLKTYGIGRHSVREHVEYRDNIKTVLPYSGEFSVSAIRYLMNRGFDPEYIIEKYGLKYCNLGEMAGRIIIPIYFEEELVSWTSRTISDTVEPRYMSCPNEKERIPHKDIFFNWDNTEDTVVLTEGPFDAMRIGFGAIAGFGMDLTERQLKLLTEKKKVIIALDNEPGAQKQAAKIHSVLTLFGIETRLWRITSGKDPGSADEEEIKELRAMV